MTKDVFFVFAQFSIIGIFIYLQGFIPASNWLLSFHLLGGLLGLWSILSMSSSKLNIFPKVKNGSTLVKAGPYKVIRHPMYTALLLYFIPHALAGTTNGIIYIAFITILTFKLNYEEKLLLKAFEDYPAYRQNTYALLPFIY
jgi:protein-S-isoprenylcysteine O-methyltransferase Ste14